MKKREIATNRTHSAGRAIEAMAWDKFSDTPDFEGVRPFYDRDAGHWRVEVVLAITYRVEGGEDGDPAKLRFVLEPGD